MKYAHVEVLLNFLIFKNAGKKFSSPTMQNANPRGGPVMWKGGEHRVTERDLNSFSPA